MESFTVLINFALTLQNIGGFQGRYVFFRGNQYSMFLKQSSRLDSVLILPSLLSTKLITMREERSFLPFVSLMYEFLF